MTRHVGAAKGVFVRPVFSLNDADELSDVNPGPDVTRCYGVTVKRDIGDVAITASPLSAVTVQT